MADSFRALLGNRYGSAAISQWPWMDVYEELSVSILGNAKHTHPGWICLLAPALVRNPMPGILFFATDELLCVAHEC